jgi:hypothetical protein
MAFQVTRLMFMLRRNRVMFVVVAAMVAAVGARVGGIHHVMGPAFGFWDGPA